MTLEQIYSDLQEQCIETFEDTSWLEGMDDLILNLNNDLYIRLHLSSDLNGVEIVGFNVCTDNKRFNMLRSYIWPSPISKNEFLCNSLDNMSYSVTIKSHEFEVFEWPHVLQIIKRMCTI